MDAKTAVDAEMAERGPASSSALVRHFRQIVLWPPALAPVRGGTQIQQHWEYLSDLGEDQPWRETRDEFNAIPRSFRNVTTASS